MMRVENPILPGFNPDPSFVRAGDDYYIATSTFEWFPGVCIHHSKNLADWEIVSYVLTDEKTFSIRGMDSSCGIWAPNLTYDDGIFYLIYTIVYTNRHRFKDTHNFLVTATDVRGPWSEPVALNRTGFDPSLFHDVDGRKWLVNMMFDYRLENKRFGGVLVQEYDPERKALTGPEYNVFKGSEIGTTEGPNIFYHDGYYYLVTAEGGTEFGHCVTMCRSRQVTGPYELCPDNPILTSSHKDGIRLQRAGHGQIIEGADGRWYMAHLCSRTVDGCSIIGRETAIQNMELTKDGWFRLSANDTASPENWFEAPGGEPEFVKKGQRKDGFVDFAAQGISLDYMTLREPPQTCGIEVTDGALKIQGGNSLSSKYYQGLLARRQQHFSYDFTTVMKFYPKDYCHMAGVVCYYNYDNYFYLHVSAGDSGKRYVRVLTMENKTPSESKAIVLEDETSPVYLKAEVRGRDLVFHYSMDGATYHPVGGTLDMRMLSDERIDGNGFTGAMVGICCQDLKGDGAAAEFSWVNYVGI